MRFFGLTAASATAIPADRMGEKVSTVFIHHGQLRPPIAARAPAPLLDGEPEQQHAEHELEDAHPVRRGARFAGVPAARDQQNHRSDHGQSPPPSRRGRQGPFTRPRGVASSNTTAMIGTGLSATPTPNVKT